MNFLSTTIQTLGLMAVGVGMAVVTGKSLLGEKVLDVPSNPGGLQCSPYGEMIAIGLQGKVDTYFHGGAHSHAAGEHHEDCEGCKHEHDHDELPSGAPWTDHVNHWLTEMDHEWEERTNPVPPSPALRLYQMRKAEDRLRFAYQLDPSNYGNYVSYNYFLSMSLGGRPELTPQADALTERTIRYCLSKEDDLQASLTAAAAVDNQLDKLQTDYIREEKKPNLELIRQKVALLKTCIDRHLQMKQQWQQNGQWQEMSTIRRQEIDEQLDYVQRSQKGRIKTMAVIENGPTQPDAVPPFLKNPQPELTQPK